MLIIAVQVKAAPGTGLGQPATGKGILETDVSGQSIDLCVVGAMTCSSWRCGICLCHCIKTVSVEMTYPLLGQLVAKGVLECRRVIRCGVKQVFVGEEGIIEFQVIKFKVILAAGFEIQVCEGVIASRCSVCLRQYHGGRRSQQKQCCLACFNVETLIQRTDGKTH